jgi:hypothetical protein
VSCCISRIPTRLLAEVEIAKEATSHPFTHPYGFLSNPLPQSRTGSQEEGVRFKKAIVRFEVFTAVIVKITVFWDVTPCSVLPPSSGWKNNPKEYKYFAIKYFIRLCP